MVDILSPLYDIAGSILTTAQPKWDGGIINFMLENVLFVNTSDKASPGDHVVETIRSGGYLAGLVCGLIWSILLMIVGFGLCVCHCRRNSGSKASVMYTMVAHRIQSKRGAMEQSFLCKAIQFILSDIFVLIAFIMCILAFVVNAHLNTAMTSVNREDAVIPSVARAVNNLHDYVKFLAPHAREATKPIVDEIVYKTELMQNSSRELFSKALTKKMKGDILQDNGIMLIDYLTIVYKSMEDIRDSQSKLLETPVEKTLQNAKRRMEDCCKEIDKTGSPTLISKCKQILGYYVKGNNDTRIINFDFKKVQLQEAPSLVTLLGKYKQTPTQMKAEMAVTLKKKQAMEDRLYLKSKRVLKVEESIRNMTAEQWDDLEEKLNNVSGTFDNITNFLYGDGHQKVVKYEGLRNALYVIVLFLMMAICLICSVIYIHHFCVPGQLTRRIRTACKISLYSSMIILSFVVLVCTGTFLMGGYAQTEVCRYLEERPHEYGNHSGMVLDKIVNSWLNEHWSTIEKSMGNESSMPVPRPRDIFYGLQTTCKANQSIMLAINALDSMDMSAVSKPEMTQRFLRLGRELMHDGFRNTNPSDLLRPTMKSEFVQLLELVKNFIEKDNYQDYIDELSKPLLQMNVTNLMRDMNELKNMIQAWSKKGEDTFSVNTIFGIAQAYLKDAMKEVNIFEIEMRNQIRAFIDLRNHQNISAIVKPMFPAVVTLSSYVYNVTKWIEDADVLYDQVIIERTKRKSPEMMAESTEKIMSVLGPCRHIYNAYTNVVYASCSVVVQSLNLMWFFMGCSVFFLTPCVVIGLLILTKTIDSIGDTKPDYRGNGFSNSTRSKVTEKAIDPSEEIEMNRNVKSV